MFDHNFRLPVSLDCAPPHHQCEWCEKAAVYRVTALGGPRHNDGGLFCEECSEKFIRDVAASLNRVPPDHIPLPPCR